MRTKQKIKSTLTLPELIIYGGAVDKELFVCSVWLSLCLCRLNERAAVKWKGITSRTQLWSDADLHLDHIVTFLHNIMCFHICVLTKMKVFFFQDFKSRLFLFFFFKYLFCADTTGSCYTASHTLPPLQLLVWGKLCN